MLQVRNLIAHYGDFQALFGIDADVNEGERVALIGSNGAGKSTLLKSIAGLMRSSPQSIVFDGRPIGAIPAAEVALLGIALVPEGRRLFPSLSVEENLLMGAFNERAGSWNLARVYEVFPALAAKRDGRDRSRVDVQSALADVRRDLARPRARNR